MSVGNQKRGLADVVTVDAWHAAFSEVVEAAGLHVDVVFMTGRFGGAADEEVRFRMSLKRAEVVVVHPPFEPMAIDPRSVSRDAPCMTVQTSDMRKSVRKSGAALGVKGSVGSQSHAAGGINLEVGSSSSRERSLEITQATFGMTATQSRNGEGDYRWAVSPTVGEVLDGRPWASDIPRLTMEDRRSDKGKTLPPTVRVEVRCRREDLHITDIALRDEGRWNAIKLGAEHRNKIKAAEALIRTRLFEEGLISGSDDLSDPYAVMTLTAVAAESVR